MKIDGATFAARIDEYCEERNITKEEFFAETGITSGTLSQWRTSTYNPSVKKIKAVLSYVQMSIEEFMTSNGFVTEQKKTTTDDGDGLSKDEKALIAL